MVGCFGGPSVAPETPPDITSEPALVAAPVDGQPGKIALQFRGEDYVQPDMVVPAGAYAISVENVNSPRDIGFFLRQPDKYGREIIHLAVGAGIRKGTSRTFEVRLEPGQRYLFNCPITESPNKVLTAVAMRGGEPVVEEAGEGELGEPIEVAPEATPTTDRQALNIVPSPDDPALPKDDERKPVETESAEPKGKAWFKLD